MARNFLRPHQVERVEDDIKIAKATLDDPASVLEDRGQTVTQLQRMERGLVQHAPPELNGKERDQVSKRCDELLSEIVSDGMPSDAEMRRAPPGAVAKHQRWERRNKQNILAWKAGILALNKGNPDKEVASLEPHRPGSTLALEGGLIEGKTMSFPSAAYKSNYDDIFGREEVAPPSDGEALLSRMGVAPDDTPKEAALRADFDASEEEIERLRGLLEERSDEDDVTETSEDRAAIRLASRRRGRGRVLSAIEEAAIDMPSIEAGELPADLRPEEEPAFYGKGAVGHHDAPSA